jgi:uncharacterized DUF497 family protein
VFSATRFDTPHILGVQKIPVKVTFDPDKRERTLRERGLDFADAPKVFDGRQITVPDARVPYPEPRFQTVGYLDGRMTMVVWTPAGEGRRIISMRKCNDREQKAYRQRLGEG